MKKAKRNKKIIEFYQQGLSLIKIGDRYKISHQRVLQILEEQKIPRRPKRSFNPEKWEVRKCVICGKKFDILKSSPQKNCSQKCANKSISIGLLKHFTLEEFSKFKNRKEYNAKRCNLYYHQVLKHKPYWKEKSREYNKRASLKRKLKNNKKK